MKVSEDTSKKAKFNNLFDSLQFNTKIPMIFFLLFLEGATSRLISINLTVMMTSKIFEIYDRS